MAERPSTMVTQRRTETNCASAYTPVACRSGSLAHDGGHSRVVGVVRASALR